MRVFRLLLGLLAITGGIALLALALGHLLGLRASGDTFDFILAIPGVFLVIGGAALLRPSPAKPQVRD